LRDRAPLGTPGKAQSYAVFSDSRMLLLGCLLKEGK
jgi:hypothetical protein